MQMLDTKLIFMLELLELFLWCLLVVLLILCRWLNALIKVFTNEQDLTVLVIDILGFNLSPS
jgi:hypothetical protein